MRGWLGLALFAAGCSQSTEERGLAAGATSATNKLARALPVASISTRAHVIHPLLLELELRAEPLESGGQRIVARVPELGVEETLGEGPAPFVCQTTLRPMGSEPTVGGSEWLDVSCGPLWLVFVRVQPGVLSLGRKELPIPGRRVSIRRVPQLELERPRCESTKERVDVRLVAGKRVVKLEIPKLGLSLGLHYEQRGGRLDCKSFGSSAAGSMRLACFNRPGWPSDGIAGRPTEDLFEVVSGVLIVDQTWHHFERSGHQRWGVRLPCGQVRFHGL